MALRANTLRLAALTALLSTSAYATSPRALVSVGIGFPELLHAEAGALFEGRLSVEASVGWLLFNVLTGVEVTGWLLGTTTDGRPPRHALLVTAQARFNPTLQPLRVVSGGETIAAAMTSAIGYAFTTDIGF